MRLKLFHKGLVLVAALLGFEFLFVGAMAFLLHDAEVEAARLAKSKAIIDKTDNLFKTLNEMNKVFGTRGLNSETLTDPNFIAAQDSVPAQFEEIRQLVQNNPDQLLKLDRAERYIDRVKYVLLDVKQSVDDGESPFLMIEKIRTALSRLKNLRDAAYTDLIDVMHDEQVIEQKSPEAQAIMRDNQKKLLLIGMVINLGFAVVLTLMFSRGITSRLEVMLDNTLRLARRQPLNPSVPGSDEIAQLDKVFHDVADALAEADRKEAELAQLKREFVAMASHELRTPLTSIQGTLTLASEGVYGVIPAELKLRLSDSEASVDRLINLINDVLDIEKIQSGKLSFQTKQTPIQDLLAMSISSVSQFAAMNSVHIETDSSDCVVDVDRDRIVQVLINLLSNAVKFSPAGSTVHIRLADESDFLRISVHDSGPGIPPEYKEIIFDRFQQVDAAGAPKKAGSGLGLAISKAIVDQHGGTIGVTSTADTGSEFWFTLPKPRLLSSS
jgi:signal transduction histidine kinase